MFGLLQPNKEQVGNRIREIKDDLNVSFAEYGNRLGLIKPTINSYVQGYSLAPKEIIEKISKISGKPVGWFYFGEIEDYIRDYFILIGHSTILSDYPSIPEEIKEDFLIGDFKNPGWENEFGYPVEEFLDDCFAEIYHNKMREYITSIAKEFIDQYTQLDEKQKEEAVILISTEIFGYFDVNRDIAYGEKSKIENYVKEFFERNIKDQNITFDDSYLVGKLINLLNDPNETEAIISILSEALTNKRFSRFFGGEELIEIFQSIRPALMQLYAEKDTDDYYDWFDK